MPVMNKDTIEAMLFRGLVKKIGSQAINALMDDDAFVCPNHIFMPITGNRGRCNKIHFMGEDKAGETVVDDVTFYVPAELKDNWKTH